MDDPHRHHDHDHHRDRDSNRDLDHLDHDRNQNFVARAGGVAPDFKSHDGGGSKVSAANNLHTLDRSDAYSYDCEYDYNYSDGGSFVDALRNERLKIHSFRRELPLCMHLLDTAIQYSEDRDPYEGRLSPSPLRLGCAPEGSFKEEHQQKPVLKEFLSLKPKSERNPSITELGRAQPFHIDNNNNNNNEDVHDSFPSFTKLSRDENSSRKAVYMQSLENNNMHLQMNGAPERCESRSSSDEYILIKADQDEKGKVDGMEGNSKNTTVQRKARRTWSPDLHQRFLNALQQLGGAQVATPKQIRELMNVDGLTNDEVKSHLQKFRLHMRRPTFPMSPYNHNQGATTIHDRHRHHQGPHHKAHLVLFGGIWVPSSSDLLFTNLESDLTSGRSSSQTTLCTSNY